MRAPPIPFSNTASNPRGGPERAFSTRPHRAGERVSALIEEITTETEMVTANCEYSRPVMPGMKIVGTNTASRTSVVAITGVVICVIAFSVASLADSPSSAMMRSTFSTTMMASSTTMPMASTSAKRLIVLSDMPASSSTAKVPISETGIATVGMIVARQLPRNTKTTATTSPKVIIKVMTTSSSERWTNSVVSKGMS